MLIFKVGLLFSFKILGPNNSLLIPNLFRVQAGQIMRESGKGESERKKRDRQTERRERVREKGERGRVWKGGKEKDAKSLR